MNLERMAKVVRILMDAGVDKHESFFDFQHDVMYIPYNEQDNETAAKLDQAGCYWDSEVECWASF